MSMKDQIQKRAEEIGTKWADVAHYYAKTHYPQRREEWLHLVQDGPNIGIFVPILRHRDDMTEADAREVYRLAWGFDIDISVSVWDSGIDWVESLHGMYHPAVFIWLISRGFDMFDLIESGQAIRKEVANG